jgi:acetylornithine/succinyldiaminopimelate/putrescine aminotransferase
MIDVSPPLNAADTARAAAARGLLVSVWTANRIRVVTHLDVTPAEVDQAASILREVLERG